MSVISLRITLPADQVTAARAQLERTAVAMAGKGWSIWVWDEESADALREKARREIEREIEAAALRNMLQRMVDETAGGHTPCLCTMEHARNALNT